MNKKDCGAEGAHLACRSRLLALASREFPRSVFIQRFVRYGRSSNECPQLRSYRATQHM